MINDIDTGLINFIKIIVFGWLFFFAFLSAKYLIFKQYQSIYILIIFHCFFLGLPLLLDLVVGQPAYDRFPSIKIASNDETTFWIYCLYVSIVPVIWWYTGRSRKTKQSVSLLIDRNRMSFPLSLNFSQINNYRLGKNFKLLVKLLCYLLLFSPAIICLFSPNPTVYLTYGVKGSGLLSGDELNYHRFVQLASLVSLLGFTGLIVLQTNKKLSFLNFYFWLTLFIPLIISIWLNGKRHIVAFALFILFMTSLAKGSIKGGKFLALALSIIIIFGLFSFSYQTSLVRSVRIKEIYEISRLDFARDHLLKLSIYSELNPDKVKILDSRFQTVYNASIHYIPRFLWQNKPKIYDYKKFIVAAARKISVKDVIAGITGIWLGESLSNFGWMGFLIGPFVLSLFCRVGDATNDKFIMVFTSLTALVWFILSLGAATHFLLVWLILMSKNMFYRNRFSKKTRYLKV